MAVLDVRLYGSCARGDAASDSDVDVLAIHDGSGSSVERELAGLLHETFGTSVQLSVYSDRRIREMYMTGHLFAWHLHRESKPIAGLAGKARWLEGLGQPSRYERGLEDAAELREILRESAAEVTSSGGSLVYEAGVTFVSCRNLALVFGASQKQFSFRRDSPYLVADWGGPAFRLERCEYELLMAARHCGDRSGVAVPTIGREWLERVQLGVSRWADNVLAEMGERNA